MFKNYLLLSLKVLKRKPFYTFISLFGISFTLMILMLITSMFDATLGANQPLSERDRLVIIPMIEQYTTVFDTIIEVDTIAMDNGELRYDTTETLNDQGKYMSSGSMSYNFAMDNLTDLDNAERFAFFDNGQHVEGYLEGSKFSFAVQYVSDQYFDIFDFNFIYGGPLNADDEREANKAVVITDKSSLSYFGRSDEDVIGREMDLGGDIYTVRGVISRPLSDSDLFSGDVFVPITRLDPRQLNKKTPGGGLTAVFLAPTASKRAALIAELEFLGENYQLPAESEFESFKIYSGTFLQAFATDLTGEWDMKAAVKLLFIPILLLLVLFIALPLLNLVNLNIGRVYERKGEIGVRKAFGANARDILYQFIFENMVLTIIGGAVGMALAIFAISYINANDLLGSTRLSYSAGVFVYFMLIIIVFGFFSGILPAYRMSRSNVANSLR